MRSAFHATHARGIKSAVVITVLLVHGAVYADDQPWFRFSSVMEKLSKNQEFMHALIERIGRDPRAGGILGPDQIKRFREILLGKQFEALDTFPTMTVREMGQAVHLAARALPPAEHPETKAAEHDNAPAEEALGIPAAPAPPADDAFLKQVGFDLAIGDRLDAPRAAQFADASRLADVVNRLARNVPGEEPRYRVRVGDAPVKSPEQLLAVLSQQGHTVAVRDSRYFANFGDLIYQGRDVLTPFWLDTEILVPNRGRTLRVPASHSQHELSLTGPVVNGDLAFYFGIDGLTEFRPIVTKDQAWTYGHVARTYSGADALEVMRFASAIIRTYDRVKAAHPDLPFGGYYELGVCNDVNAMIEMHMQGETTLFPLTHNPALFSQRGEVDNVVQRLPVDGRESSTPDVRRVLGSLPVAKIESLAMSGLRSDLESVAAAFASGSVGYAQGSTWRFWTTIAAIAALALIYMKPLIAVGAILLIVAILWFVRRSLRKQVR